MQVNITARHTDVSQSFRERITTEVEGLSDIFDRINLVEVTMSDDAGVPKSDIGLRLNHHEFQARGQGTSLQQAFDISLEKMERQLRKYKGKLIGRRAEEIVTQEAEAVE
jgi:putative sigma-54 modulation protein